MDPSEREEIEAAFEEIAYAPVYTASTHRIWVPYLDAFYHFTPRERMPSNRAGERLGVVARTLPPVKLPVDWTKGNALQFPYYGNDQYGDCMYAAAAHGVGGFTGNVGTELIFDTKALIAAYRKLSGGDNGLDEDMIVAEWKKGLVNDPKSRIFDSVDIDPNNAALMQAAVYLFGGVQFMLSVPNRWINNFKTGAVWDAPATPNPMAGHGIWFIGVQPNGNYQLLTWGTYGFITPAGVKVCDPSAFAVASLQWFNAQGYAPNGLHYTELAPLWNQLGGKPWPASPFPSPGPTPQPGPTPVPIPTPGQIPSSRTIGYPELGLDLTLNWTATQPLPPAG